MSNEMVIFILTGCILLLVCIVIYQQISLRIGTQRKLAEISEELKEMLDNNTNGEIMVFTENRELMKLTEQINRLSEENRRIRADFCRSEISSKKMLSNISHDIKTPMTVVLGYLEIIRLNKENTAEMIEKVEKKAQDVMELINEFFTLAKLEAGDMDIELSGLNINEICRESILDFYGLLTESGCQVNVDIPEVPVYVCGNKKALQRILFNLISNAIRYGADGHYLGISLRTEESSVFIDITDKGRGIGKEFAEHVFDRLFTMEDSRSRLVQGNGLGLTIAKNLAEQMNGSISLTSEPYVKTVFTLKLKKISYKTGCERNL